MTTRSRGGAVPMPGRCRHARGRPPPREGRRPGHRAGGGRMIGSRVVDGFPALTLASAAAGGIEATFVPGAGMVGCSLRHRGEELLGQRRGLRAYVADRATMGIPLLYPWANRVARRRFPVAGREVAIDPEATPLRLDADGLPMHGLLTAATGWHVERHEALADGAVLAARFDFAAHEALMAAFPFAHQLRFEAALSGADADDRHDGPGAGRRARADRVRLSPLSPAAGRRARGLARRGAGPRAAAPGRADAAHRRARQRGGARGPAGGEDVRRRLRRAGRRGALRPRPGTAGASSSRSSPAIPTRRSSPPPTTT